MTDGSGNSTQKASSAPPAQSDKSAGADEKPVDGVPQDVAPEELLVARLRSGDALAGEELVRRHCTLLVRYLQKLVGSDQLAEELHQQAWLSVLENIGRFEAANVGGGFKAWLYRIATNKANDHWRSRGREKSAKEGLKLVTDEHGPEAGARMEATEQDLKLRRCIELLPDNQKQVLLLRYYSGLKFVDIAQTLGCPLNTALGRMHKAMIRLRALMEDESTSAPSSELSQKE